VTAESVTWRWENEPEAALEHLTWRNNMSQRNSPDYWWITGYVGMTRCETTGNTGRKSIDAASPGIDYSDF
jgi:hypothetical protein